MRRQPVAFALIDAAFLADSKWRALGIRLPDPSAFNSALGAWLRVLTAARRNGRPDVDAAEESEDQTYLPDLIAVGLLTETGIPDKPYQAWAPARPKYPSDTVTSAPNVTSAPFPPPDSASTPFPSLPLTSGRGVQGGGKPPKQKAKREPWQEEFRAVVEAQEAAIVSARPLPVDEAAL